MAYRPLRPQLNPPQVGTITSPYLRPVWLKCNTHPENLQINIKNESIVPTE